MIRAKFKAMNTEMIAKTNCNGITENGAYFFHLRTKKNIIITIPITVTIGIEYLSKSIHHFVEPKVRDTDNGSHLIVPDPILFHKY